MKSAVFYGAGDLRVEERPIPQPGPRDVVIQVKACGVCGTDVHIFDGDKGAADCTPPTVLGHEFSGVVHQVGEAVTSFAPGDRVCVDPNRYCGSCDYCRDGMAHYCRSLIGYGTTVDGGFAQYCAVDQGQVYRLGEQTSFLQGAMTEPLACCLHGVDLCNIRPGASVVVIGGGMIGLLMLQLVRLAGAARTALLEPVAAKRAIARGYGGDILCIDPMAGDAGEALGSGHMDRIDTVIECVGKPDTIRQAVSLAGNKSTVMMFGLTKPDDMVDIKPFEMFQKEIVLKSSFINPYTQRRALELIDAGRIDVTGMIAEICGLADLADILSDSQRRAKGKYVIDPWL